MTYARVLATNDNRRRVEKIVIAYWCQAATKPMFGEIPSVTHRKTPPDQPEASSAETRAVGIRKMMAGRTYKNTQASP